MIESTIHFVKHLFGFCGEPHPNIFIGGIGLVGYCFNCCKNIINMKKKLTTHEKRKAELDKLNGKYNGWWIYAYYKDILFKYVPRGKDWK